MRKYILIAIISVFVGNITGYIFNISYTYKLEDNNAILLDSVVLLQDSICSLNIIILQDIEIIHNHTQFREMVMETRRKERLAYEAE